MARIEITNEREAGAGWAFDVVIGGLGCPDSGDGADGGRPVTATGTRHEVRLSWADYEYWSHGAVSPAMVVRLVLAFLLDQSEADLELRKTMDLARVRCRWPGVDAFIAGRL